MSDQFGSTSATDQASIAIACRQTHSLIENSEEFLVEATRFADREFMTTPTKPLSLEPSIFFARDVAMAFADETARGDEQERSALVLVSMDIGQSLADCGHPGRWDLFSPKHMFDRITFLSEHERVGVAMRSLGMFQFLALTGLLGFELAIRIGEEIVGAAPASSILTGLHERFVGSASDFANDLADDLADELSDELLN